MNRLILAALATLALPLTASAVPSSEGPMIHPVAPKTQVTGTVKVAYPRCRGCLPVVSIENGTEWTRITGDLALDVAAFDGKTVTVKGEPGNDGALSANGFAPGKSADFVTGTVVLASPDCPPNARCAAKVYLDTGDRKIVVTDGWQYGLTALEGAKVTLRGEVVHYRCLGCESTLTVNEDRNILVRARIEKLAHGMNGQTHIGTKDNGETVLISGKKWEDRNFASVWLSGKMTTERISGAPMFRATSASKSIPVIPAVDPFLPRPVVSDGSNVSRDAGTTGGAAANPAPAGTAAGAGILRD